MGEAATVPWEAFDITHPDHNEWVERTGRCLASDCTEHQSQKETAMFVSEDGTVTGSVDVSRLDQIKAKTDEAKAQVEGLKAEVQAGAEQVARDAERASQGERALGINSTGRDDGDADERAESRKSEQADAERQQREADQRRQADQAAQAEREKADAEAAKAKSASAQKRS